MPVKIRKKDKQRSDLRLLTLLLVLILLVATACQSQEEPVSEGSIEVLLSVDCSNAVAAGVPGADTYEPDGAVLTEAKILVAEESSVLDTLQASDLIVNTSTAVLGVYVKSIQGISEGKGGWIFSINGEFPHTSASNVPVEAGDEVAFYYTVTPGDVPGSPY